MGNQMRAKEGYEGGKGEIEGVILEDSRMWVEDREAGVSVVLMGQFGVASASLCSVSGARAALAALTEYELAAPEHACLPCRPRFLGRANARVKSGQIWDIYKYKASMRGNTQVEIGFLSKMLLGSRIYLVQASGILNIDLQF